MNALLTMATILCTGLMIGVEFAVSAFINPVLWKLEPGPQARAIGLFARMLGRAMPVWYGAGFLLLLAEAFTLRHAPGSLLLDVAAAIWALVIVLTLLFLIPINNRMARMQAAEFSQSARVEHRKWDWMHRGRVAALVVALSCFLAAVRL
jgi:uncharacterized membrane protein